MGTEQNLVLDLTTLVPDRPTVRIKSSINPEGRFYEFRTREELSLVELQTIQEYGKKVVAVLENEERSPEDTRLAEDWVLELVGMIFHTKVEEEVLDELPLFTGLVPICQAFTRHCLQGSTSSLPPETNRATRRRAARTGAK